MILIMCSCGIRVGAFDYLKVGDVMPVYRLDGKLVVPKAGAYRPLEDGVLARARFSHSFSSHPTTALTSDSHLD